MLGKTIIADLTTCFKGVFDEFWTARADHAPPLYTQHGGQELSWECQPVLYQGKHRFKGGKVYLTTHHQSNRKCDPKLPIFDPYSAFSLL